MNNLLDRPRGVADQARGLCCHTYGAYSVISHSPLRIIKQETDAIRKQRLLSQLESLLRWLKFHIYTHCTLVVLIP